MSPGGFRLSRLTLSGAGMPDAEIRFTSGLNVIFGASDTGKTFVGQCIDFMFGASRTPKEIPEAAGYDTVSVALFCGQATDEIVLQRALRGGAFRLLERGEAGRVLGEKHEADREDTISHLLLGLSGLRGRRVRLNAQGKTRTLSFRDIARLVIVDETSVIAERSPILTGQRDSATVESSVFRFLLTGVDDSAVMAQDDPKIAKGRYEGKSELLAVLLQQAKERLVQARVDASEQQLQDELLCLDAILSEATCELAKLQQSAADLETARREAWENLRRVDSRLSVLAELQQRFGLLQEQYFSDLRRLDSISEAGFRLAQMAEERCPVCGALPEHHDREHQQPESSPDEVAAACSAEAVRIRTLIADLERTMADNEREIGLLAAERSSKSQTLATVAAELQKSLQPRVQRALEKVKESQARRDWVRQALDLVARVREYEEITRTVEKPAKRQRADGPPTTVGADEAEEFCQAVEALLSAWHFPNLGRVTFSEAEQDLIINGQRRSNHGKGVRAITHSAFNLALLRHSLATGRPHPGFVLIDSPLIVYRQPDPEETTFNPDVKAGFYRSLASDFGDAQVIVLENVHPPGDIAGSANLIEFTGSSTGRRGFIPTK